MSRIPTVVIDTENGPVIINKSAFNPAIHTLHDATALASGTVTPRNDGPTVAQYVEAGYLAKNYPPEGYTSRSTPEEIEAAIVAQEAVSKPVDPAKAPEPPTPANNAPVTLLVTKKGKKFIVVDGEGKPVTMEGIDAEGYGSEADAWTAIMALSGAKNG